MTNAPSPNGRDERGPATLPTRGDSLEQSNEILPEGKRAVAGRRFDLDWALWNAAGRPDIFWGSHPKLRSVRAYLLGVKSDAARASVRAAVRKGAGRGWSGMSSAIRVLLHDSIFKVMDNLESQAGGRPDHPTVVQLRVALNLVADDLRWNDSDAAFEAAANELVVG
ncbi:MAG: hypothetical protein IID31_12780 [Planctomycetes bacterium]|nr:hypothetical protein [Planctomycetota bacterium]